MVRDWSEFLQEFRRSEALARQRPHELGLLVSQFTSLLLPGAGRQQITNVLSSIPAGEKLAFMAAFATLAADLTWPTVWEPALRDLKLGLDELLLRTDVTRMDSLPHLVLTSEEQTLISIDRDELLQLRTFLDAPISRSALPVVGGSCSRALFRIGVALSVGYGRLRPPRQDHADARNAYLHAFRNYERAARELNRLFDSPLFIYLDVPLAA